MASIHKFQILLLDFVGLSRQSLRELLKSLPEAIGNDYTHHHLPASNSTELERLLSPSSPFDGNLILLVAKEVGLFFPLLFPQVEWVLTIERLRSSSKGYAPGDEHRVMLALKNYCQKTKPTCRILVLCQPHPGEPDIEGKPPSFLRLEAQPSDGPLDLGVLDLATHRKRFGFKADPPPPTKPEAIAAPSKKYGDFAMDAWSEFGIRLQQEFHSEGSERVFLDLCQSVFPLDTSRPSLKPYHVLLESLRLARRMVNWTLEGEPFECTILLCTGDECGTRINAPKSLVARLYKFVPPIPFVFQELSKIHDDAEMTQSAGLLLFVNVDTGRLEKILIHTPEPDKGQVHRLSSLCSLADDSAVVVHMRAGHVVEVYGKVRDQAQYLLKYDGFEWLPGPFRDLEFILQSRLRKAHGSLVEAVSTLLDGYKGSIIVLLHGDDEKTFKTLEADGFFPPMRAGVEPEDQETSAHVWNIPTASLTGILQIDGAHVIDSKGKLAYFGRKAAFKVIDKDVGRVDVAELEKWCAGAKHEGLMTWRDDKRLTILETKKMSKRLRKRLVSLLGEDDMPPANHSDDPGNAGPGAGGAAARDISLVLRNSHIVKVSASGALKIFVNGERFYAPPD